MKVGFLFLDMGLRRITVRIKRQFRGFGLVLALFLLAGQAAWAHSAAVPSAMHIMEGFLPLGWAVFWWIVALPFWVVGFIQIRRVVTEKPQQRLLLGLAGGFIFVLSALKIPSVTGSSSHPTGTGLGAMLFGPFVVTILGTIALIFQALLVAHGGLSTLGANAMSMAIGGPLIAYYAVWLPLKGRVSTWLSVGLAAFVADLATYLITTTQLALAFPDPASGFWGSWATFAGIFAITQIPLAIGEAILTVLIFNGLQSTAHQELRELGLEGV
jgi:cobalt/nickel transport system permease protein